MRRVLGWMLRWYRRRRILAQTNAAYAALRADPVAWAEVEAERRAWDAALADGFEEEGDSHFRNDCHRLEE